MQAREVAARPGASSAAQARSKTCDGWSRQHIADGVRRKAGSVLSRCSYPRVGDRLPRQSQGGIGDGAANLDSCRINFV